MTTSITLKSGPKKLLLLDANAVERNRSRSPGITQPVGRVFVLAEDGSVEETYTSSDVTVNGVVKLEYQQHAFLTTWGRETINAAYVTTGEVIVRYSPAEAETKASTAEGTQTAPSKPTKPQKPAKPVVTESESNKSGE